MTLSSRRNAALSLLLATTVAIIAPAGNAQESVWSAYFEVAGKFYDDKEYTKAEQLLVDAVKEAERLPGSKERLLKCLPILSRVYIAEGKSDQAQQVNDRIQSLGGTVISEDGIQTTGLAKAGEVPPAGIQPGESPSAPKDDSKTKIASANVDKKLEFTVETGKPQKKTEVQADSGNTGDDSSSETTASSSAKPDDPEGKGLQVEEKKTVIAAATGLAGVSIIDAKVQKAPEILKLLGHCGWCKTIDVAEDGTRAISGSDDDTIRVWDLTTGKEVAKLDGHEHDVNCVVFSPAGNTALSGSSDTTARLWDLDAGTEIRQFKGHSNIVTCVAFAPGGARVATGSYDGTVRIWDALTGKELQKLGGDLDVVKCIAYSPEGDMLVSAGKDKLITLWRLRDGTAIRKFSGHQKEITGIEISPDGSRILSVSRDLTIRLWDLGSGDELKCMVGHGNWIQKAVFLGLDKAMSGGLDKTIRVWNLDEGKELRSFTIGTYGMFSLDFSKEGDKALTGSDDFALRLWKVHP